MGKGDLLLHPRCRLWEIWETGLFNSKHPLCLLHPTVSWCMCSGCSGCPLRLAGKCGGFICSTRAPAEIGHPPFPSSWEERDYLFTYKQFFFPQVVATQREEKQKDAPYELRSLKMFILTWGQGTGSCTHVWTVGQRTDQGVQQESNQGHRIRGKSRRWG